MQYRKEDCCSCNPLYGGAVWFLVSIRQTRGGKENHILDESTKKHVKKMSEEAERKLRSRRTIVLDPSNPSMKSPAAVEAALAKNYNKKKEATLWKRNLKNFQVGGSSKSSHTAGSSSSTTFKGNHSFPHSFLLDQPTALGALNISRSIDDALPSQMIGKLDGNSGYEKGSPAMTFNAMRETPRGKGNNIAEPIDLQRMLITLLRNKPHGLTLKALEKAFQPIVPNPLEKIKPILRNVARYKSPGRYILLPGVDFRSLNKLHVGIGSFSNANRGQRGGTSDGESDGSDSESDGSDIGVDTGSNSSSSAGAGSGSESGSESEASFNSKDGLDEDMDFMIGNEQKEPKNKREASVQKLLSTIPVRSPVGRSLQNETDEMQDKDRSRCGHSDYSAVASKGKQRMDSRAKNAAERIKKLKAGKLAQAQGYASMDVQLREGTQSFNSIDLESFGKSPVVNRRGTCLQRDLSDLKSGEPVKSAHDETLLAKQFERKITFKHPGSRANTSGEGKLKAVDAETEYHTQLSQMNYGLGADELGVGQGIESEGSSKGSTTAPGNAISKRGTEGGTASCPEEEKRQERNSLEDVADKGKGPIIADENNGNQKGESSSEDDSCYFKYEKAGPEFKGPIRTMAQYQEYVKEYNEKYPDYVSLLKNVEGFRCKFEQLCNKLEKAKNRDEDKYREILGQIKETYERHVPHHKRLKMIFVVLHQELEHMKQMMSDFANAQNKKSAQKKKNARNRRE